MGKLQSLAKDTAIYGLSSIIGRFLNYLLVPLYTTKMSVESGNYGVVTNIYAWVAILLVFLTFGFETTFFRFASFWISFHVLPRFSAFAQSIVRRQSGS